MIFHIITIFPDIFDSYLDESIVKRAREQGAVHFEFYNSRDYTDDPHRSVDDKPYGGGPGMVMRALPILKAVERAKSKVKSQKSKVILFTPHGERFSNQKAQEYIDESDEIVMICGRYEGIDERARKALVDTYGKESVDEISIGGYILTGGELPAMVVIDAVTRRIPGVLGDEHSVEEKRVAGSEVYTRPERLEYKGRIYNVPEVLLSGHHGKIERWRDSLKEAKEKPSQADNAQEGSGGEQ